MRFIVQSLKSAEDLLTMNDHGSNMARGPLVAASLSGSWRRFPPPVGICAEELDEIVPLLVSSGAGALGRRVLDSSLPVSPRSMAILERAYLFCRMQGALHAHNIKQVFSALRAVGVEPLLMKGWAIARLYAEPGLRSYSDMDLCIRPDQHAAARDALRSMQAKGIQVDLHDAAGRLDALSWNDLYEFSEIARLGDTDVRVLGAEDHLRIISLHFLAHGGWRPLWLCDVAVALEARGVRFDWERCLGPDSRRARWVCCAIKLAHHLLGAEVSDAPLFVRDVRLPSWLIPSVLRQWNTCLNPNHREMALTSLLGRLHQPDALFKELRERWDRPLRATIELNGPFSEMPRALFQLASLLIHSGEIPRQLMRAMRSLIERLGQDGDFEPGRKGKYFEPADYTIKEAPHL